MTKKILIANGIPPKSAMLTYTQFTPLPNNPNPQAKPSHAPCRVVRCVIISSKPDKEINAAGQKSKGENASVPLAPKKTASRVRTHWWFNKEKLFINILHIIT